MWARQVIEISIYDLHILGQLPDIIEITPGLAADGVVLPAADAGVPSAGSVRYAPADTAATLKSFVGPAPANAGGPTAGSIDIAAADAGCLAGGGIALAATNGSKRTIGDIAIAAADAGSLAASGVEPAATDASIGFADGVLLPRHQAPMAAVSVLRPDDQVV